MNLDDFLSSHYGAVADSGTFTLNPLRAKEQIIDSLRFEAWGFPRHLLAAAFLGGAKQLEVGTPGQFGIGLDSFLKEARAPDYFFQTDVNLEPDGLESFDEWLLQPSDRFHYRLALAYHQMQTLGLAKFYVEVWQGKSYHRLRVSSNARSVTHHKKALWQSAFRGLRLYIWEEGVRLFATSQVTDDVRKTGLAEAALWSPVKVMVNARTLNQPTHSSLLLASEYWKNPERPLHFQGESQASLEEYSMLALIDRDKLDSRFYPVVEGVTLKAQALPFPEKQHQLHLPGLRLIIHSTQFETDASELALVQEQQTGQLRNSAQELVKKVRRKLFDPQSQSNRWYLLRHWHILKDRSLRELPLFELKSEQMASLSELRRWQEAGTLNMEADLQGRDAQIAASLLPPMEPYQFRHGYAEPRVVSLSPLGRWVALLGERWCHILHLEESDKVQILPCLPGIDPIAWHPHQPWIALKQDLRVIVWDVAEQTIVHSLNAGEYEGLFFSSDGKWLQAILLDGPSTQRWSTQTWTLQKPPLQTRGYTRLFKDCLVVTENEECISLLSAAPPHQPMTTLTTPKLIWRILDVSPDQNYIAFYNDAESIYLLDLLGFSFERLPIAPDLVLFSWDSNYLFYRDGEHICANFLETRKRRMKPHPCRRVLRSGIGLNFEEMGNNVIKTEAEPILALAQPPPLGGRDVAVTVTGSVDNRKAVLLSAEGCRVLWSYAPTHLFALTDTYLAWSSHDGVNRLELESGEIAFLEGYILHGRVPTFRTTPKFLGSNSRAYGAAPRFDLQVKQHRGTVVVDLTTGEDIPSDGALTTDFNGTYQVSCPRQSQDVEHFHYRHIDEQHSWVGDFPEGAHGSLHPQDSLSLVSSGRSTQLLRLRPEGYVPLHQEIPGCSPQFSPSGRYFALTSSDGLDIYRTKNAQKLGSLYLGRSDVSEWTWLTDQCLQIYTQLYRACSARGWKNPGQVFASVPPKLRSRQSSEVGVAPEDGELHFYSLITGRRLGVLHPLGRAWFFYNHKGEWEASDKALRFVTPQPKQDPTPGVLAALFKA